MSNNNSQVATQQPQSLQALMGNAGVMAKLNSVLGNEKKAAAFASSVISVANGNSLLRNANPMTVLGSAMVAATLDLSVVPTLGMAYIVPYKGQASFQLGWKGLVELAMRSGQYKNIIVEAVHEGELVKKNKNEIKKPQKAGGKDAEIKKLQAEIEAAQKECKEKSAQFWADQQADEKKAKERFAK